MAGLSFTKAQPAGFWARIAIIGGTGDGKSTSALRIATGLARGGTVAVIDTDNGRAKLNGDKFDFQVCELTAPYNGDRYCEALDAAVGIGARVVVVDDASREHQQMLDDQAVAADDLADKFRSTPDKMAMSAWRVAKEPRKRLMAKLAELPCHVIVTLRAEPKIDVNTKKTALGVEGYVGFARGAHAALLLQPNSDGVPDYSPSGDLAREVKLHRVVRHIFRPGEALNEEHGEALAALADGLPLSERVAACQTLEELTRLFRTLPKRESAAKKTTELFASRKKELTNGNETENTAQGDTAKGNA